MENKLNLALGYAVVIFLIVIFALFWRTYLKKSRRKYVSFREFMEVSKGYLEAEQKRENMNHLHPLDFALMHYEFYLNERGVSLESIMHITKYRFGQRGYFKSMDEWEVENAIRKYL